MPLRKFNALLVDDDEVDIETVRRAIKRAAVSVDLHVARDGVEALELLRSGCVPAPNRFVILDLNMPRMSGDEFLRELHKIPDLQNVPVVVVTTSNATRDHQAMSRWNVVGFLEKPFHVQQLDAVLKLVAARLDAAAWLE